jgi:hypothetical protein
MYNRDPLGLQSDPETPTTDGGLFQYAESHRCAAEFLRAGSSPLLRPSAPIRILYIRAIELYLKAFLRSHDYTADQLEKVHQRTGRLRRGCVKRGLSLSAEEAALLDQIAAHRGAILSLRRMFGSRRQHGDAHDLKALSCTAYSLAEKTFERLIAIGHTPRRPTLPLDEISSPLSIAIAPIADARPTDQEPQATEELSVGLRLATGAGTK